jgi:hypothetical protein
MTAAARTKRTAHPTASIAKHSSARRSRERLLPNTGVDLARKLRDVDQAMEAHDLDALLKITNDALKRIKSVIDEMVVDQRRSAKRMAIVQKRIDRNQAETSRILNRLVNGR